MEEEPKPKLTAEIRELREGAGARWWQTHVEHDGAEINRRFAAPGVVYWNAANLVSMDMFSYLSEASLCYSVSMYLATIVLSSALPELVLNRDSRTKALPGLSRFDDWAGLNNTNLRLAREVGLPTDRLLSFGEDLSSPEPVTFVKRRNKFAHGEIANFIVKISRYDPQLEREAIDQLKKAQLFYVDWFNTTPDIAQ
jgi:hypothetical protein